MICSFRRKVTTLNFIPNNQRVLHRSILPVHRPADDVEQFVGDGLLTRLIVLERPDRRSGRFIVGCLHGKDASGMFGEVEASSSVV